MPWQYICLHGEEAEQVLGPFKTLRLMQKSVKENKPKSPEFFSLMIYRHGPSGDVYKVKLNGQEAFSNSCEPSVKQRVMTAWKDHGGKY